MRLTIPSQKRTAKVFERQLFCLNCKQEIPKEARGIDATRFCSYKCKQEYMS